MGTHQHVDGLCGRVVLTQCRKGFFTFAGQAQQQCEGIGAGKISGRGHQSVAVGFWAEMGKHECGVFADVQLFTLEQLSSAPIQRMQNETGIPVGFRCLKVANGTQAGVAFEPWHHGAGHAPTLWQWTAEFGA